MNMQIQVNKHKGYEGVTMTTTKDESFIEN